MVVYFINGRLSMNIEEDVQRGDGSGRAAAESCAALCLYWICQQECFLKSAGQKAVDTEIS